MKFRGYDIKEVPGLVREDIDGQVKFNEKRIEIGSHCRGRRELETIIHELYHVLRPNDSEDTVTRAARDVMNVLWKMGYRKAK